MFHIFKRGVQNACGLSCLCNYLFISFPFFFFISKFFESIVWCSCPPPCLQLCSTTIVISVYCDLSLAKVQIQFFIFLPLSATFVTISCAALEALFHLVSWLWPLLITSLLSTGFAEAVVHYSQLFVWLAEVLLVLSLPLSWIAKSSGNFW